MEDVDLSCPFQAMNLNICSTVKYLLPPRRARFLVLNLVRLCSNFAECNPRAISAQSRGGILKFPFFRNCIFNANNYLKLQHFLKNGKFKIPPRDCVDTTLLLYCAKLEHKRAGFGTENLVRRETCVYDSITDNMTDCLERTEEAHLSHADRQRRLSQCRLIWL